MLHLYYLDSTDLRETPLLAVLVALHTNLRMAREAVGAAHQAICWDSSNSREPHQAQDAYAMAMMRHANLLAEIVENYVQNLRRLRDHDKERPESEEAPF